MKRRSVHALAVVVVLLIAAAGTLAFACSDPVIQNYCTGIPAGGCPSDAPSTCPHDAGPAGDPGDPTCAAIYSHTPDCVWTLVQTCPGYVAMKDAGHDASDATRVPDGQLRDAGFPLPEGAAGGADCAELESPDCPLAEAVGCGKTCCECETLYVCVEGGWNVWGSCDDGQLVPAPSP